MQYLPLFLLFMAALIAAYFYLQRAKARPASTTGVDERPVDTASTAPPTPPAP